MRHPLVLAVFVASGFLALSGCSTTPVDPTAGMTTTQIYSNAKSFMSDGQWDKATKFLEKLEIKAAGTELAQQAEIDKAYAQYKNGDQALAIATLNRFMRLHPSNPAIDYALYLRGLVTFHDDMGFLSSVTRQNLAERDQQALKDSFDSFKELVNRFPDSRYTADAKVRMAFIRNTLAQSDVLVAEYYLKLGAYVAAINRAQLAITEYNNTPSSAEAFYVMYQAYGKLNLGKMQADIKQIFALNYPGLDINQNPSPPKPKPWWQLW